MYEVGDLVMTSYGNIGVCTSVDANSIACFRTYRYPKDKDHRMLQAVFTVSSIINSSKAQKPLRQEKSITEDYKKETFKTFRAWYTEEMFAEDTVAVRKHYINAQTRQDKELALEKYELLLKEQSNSIDKKKEPTYAGLETKETKLEGYHNILNLFSNKVVPEKTITTISVETTIFNRFQKLCEDRKRSISEAVEAFMKDIVEVHNY